MVHWHCKWFTAALLIPPANRVGGGCCSEETGRSTSRSAFVQVMGLPNTYLPLTATSLVFVIKFNVKWFTAAGRQTEPAESAMRTLGPYLLVA